MSELPLGGEQAIPQWTLADRMRKAREHAGLKQAELAAEIGVGRTSVVNYESGNTEPSRPVLLSWALRCGVAYEWLTDSGPFGHASAKGQVRRRSRTARSLRFKFAA